jgi:lysophospholipase L1-like esterase
MFNTTGWLCLLLIGGLLPARAQEKPKWDSSYRTTYYEQKLSIFRQLPDTKKEIVFLGNSITDTNEWSEMFGNPRIKNRGISGDITFGVLARLDEVLSSKPKKIFLMIGINDIARNIPDSIIIQNIRRIAAMIKERSPQTLLYIQSILPTNEDFTQFKNHQNKKEHITNCNAQLETFCRSAGWVYVDLYSRMTDASGKLHTAYTNDGLHLTAAGYAVWKQVLEEKGYCCR